MELDESVEREKLVSEGEDDDPSPLETVSHVPVKPVIPVPQSVIMSTKKSAFPGLPATVSSTVYREPTVVIVNNSVQQRSTVASPSTATGSSLTNSNQAPMSPKSSHDGPASSGARLVYVNERGSTHSSTNGKTPSTSTDKTIKPRKMPRDPLDTATSSSSPPSSSHTLPPRPPPPSTLNNNNKNKSNHHHHSKADPSSMSSSSVVGGGGGLPFSDRALKHHSFLLSEVPDVKHMEKALLGLLDDFHSGKLRAFGSGTTMDQMTNIREQQERLAKLHFELGGAVHNMMMSEEEDSLGGSSGNNESETRAQENMTRLVKQLEHLSVSIEGLHSDAL